MSELWAVIFWEEEDRSDASLEIGVGTSGSFLRSSFELLDSPRLDSARLQLGRSDRQEDNNEKRREEKRADDLVRVTYPSPLPDARHTFSLLWTYIFWKAQSSLLGPR